MTTRPRSPIVPLLSQWWPLLMVLLAAIFLRFSILFSTALVPQTDGAYYLAQVRSIVAGDGLRFTDTPLLFWLQSAVAKLLTALLSTDTRSAIITAVKVVDAIVPPLAAIPLFALWLRWTPLEQRSWLAALTVASLAALSFELVKMTGDLQKNGFALVLLAGLIWAFDTAARRPGVGTISLMACLALGCALSHVGVFAAAMVFLLPATGYRLLTADDRRARLRTGSLIVSVMIGIVLLLTSSVPKLAALAGSLTSPGALLSGENTISRIVGETGPEALADAVPVVLAWTILAVSLAVMRRRRPEKTTAATLAGAASATAILAFPFLGGIDGLRLHLMSYLPMTVLFTWVSGKLGRRAAVLMPATLLVLNTVAILPMLPQAGQPTIAEDSYEELLSLQDIVGNAHDTVVVARHGLEWWAAWAFDAAIVPTIGATPDLWERYRRVLLLQEVRVADPAAGPGTRGGSGKPLFASGPAAVTGSIVIREGTWFRLAQAPSALHLGPDFEGVQQRGAARRPVPPRHAE